MTFKRKLGHKVKPMSSKAIEGIAQLTRDALQLSSPKVKICHLLEALQEMEALTLEVVDDHELGDEEARAFPDKDHIQVKNSVYEAACDGCGHSAFTLAHELGHLMLHKNCKPSFARGTHKIYEDSEWQADTFASEFLMDSRMIKNDATIEQLVDMFGVTPHAAQVKLSKLKK
ncbi:ImmA/IrrE family metallo-endopeptidase [Photobacterium ganghwense]|uniref:ImmA/IrrE family metallo-endopeptidase n=1 Tax=Photobacterium ganghwense TaxID=320778 RepID=UPI001A8F9F22|nr:ImmA/IrrE family metallo-endopeptidase [Photobacterium ganghwense]QSV13592.1 ImmA/IrrE family metallo-endopeptidase [Photobacterium ganghwense]